MAKVWVLPTFRGLAYLSSANFMARLIVFLDKLTNSFFSYEMVLLYSAHLDTHILLFFQAVFMIPVAILGVLVFYGIEKESFNLVLYPTLMLLFLILLRYGAEMALLIIHWEDHSLDRGPCLLFYLVLDLIAIVVLLIYVYMSLAAPPPPNTITPSRLNSLRRKLQRLSSKGSGTEVDVEANGKDAPKIVGVTRKKKKPPAVPPEGEEEEKELIPPPRPPPSPKFNYKLRRNVAHLEKNEEKVLVQDLDKQRQRNSTVLKEDSEGEKLAEADRDSPTPTFTLKLKTQSLKMYDSEPKRRSLLIETDLDVDEQKSASASPVPASVSSPSSLQEHDEELKVAETFADSGVGDRVGLAKYEEPLNTTNDDKPVAIREEEDEEWEYEYEDDVVDEKVPHDVVEQGENVAEKGLQEDLQDADNYADDKNVHQPETTISSTGYKTTAV